MFKLRATPHMKDKELIHALNQSSTSATLSSAIKSGSMASETGSMTFDAGLSSKPNASDASLPTRHMSSIYVLIASATIMLERRISYIAQPNRPQPLGIVKKLLLRLPVIIMLVYLLSHFWSLSMEHELPEYLHISFLVFFMLHCIDHIVTGLILTLEFGRSELDLNHQHSPDFIEWVGTLYLATATLNLEQSPVVGMIIIELHKLLLMSLLDTADCLAPYRLIPTSIMGLAHVGFKVWWSVVKRDGGVPVIFWLSGIPELFLVTLLVILSLVYVVSYLVMSGDMRFDITQLLDGVTLRDDFKVAIRKFAILISQRRSPNSGFSKEFEPIFAPIGIGLPPTELINVHARPTGFRLNLDEQEIRKKSSSWIQLTRSLEMHEVSATIYNSLYMWRCSGLAMLRPILFAMEKVLRRLFTDRNGYVSGDPDKTALLYRDGGYESGQDESDFDFTLDESDVSSEWSSVMDDHDILDAISDSRVDNAEETVHGDDDELYKEIFWLAQDMQPCGNDAHSTDACTENLQNQKSNAMITSASLISFGQILQLANSENGVMTRSRRQPRPIEGRRSRPGDDEPQAISIRNCVVCYQEPRQIVLRPCGCLCLCDTGCREALALRDYKECPCCRRVVKGYQRIYEP
ncbi:hypothetical protein BDV3_001452 [Batrachochytrium dendrobatidis]